MTLTLCSLIDMCIRLGIMSLCTLNGVECVINSNDRVVLHMYRGERGEQHTNQAILIYSSLHVA